jgi:hypothetical protein
VHHDERSVLRRRARAQAELIDAVTAAQLLFARIHREAQVRPLVVGLTYPNPQLSPAFVAKRRRGLRPPARGGLRPGRLQGLRPFDSAQDRPRPRLRMVYPERFSAKGRLVAAKPCLSRAKTDRA